MINDYVLPVAKCQWGNAKWPNVGGVMSITRFLCRSLGCRTELCSSGLCRLQFLRRSLGCRTELRLSDLDRKSTAYSTQDNPNIQSRLKYLWFYHKIILISKMLTNVGKFSHLSLRFASFQLQKFVSFAQPSSNSVRMKFEWVLTQIIGVPDWASLVRLI